VKEGSEGKEGRKGMKEGRKEHIKERKMKDRGEGRK
jgi:hypothetical protein